MDPRPPGAVERLWGIALDVVRWLRLPRPVWCLVFSYWDDAAGCGCWRERRPGIKRWQDVKPYERPD